MRTLVGLALITKLITVVLRFVGALLIAPVRTVAMVTPGSPGIVARRAVLGVGGGAAIVALLLARVLAAGVDPAPASVTERVDTFVAAGRRAIREDVAGAAGGSRGAARQRAAGSSDDERGQITPRDTSLAALLAAADEAASHSRARPATQFRAGGR